MNKILIILVMIAGFVLKGQCQSKNFIDQPFIEVNGSYDSLILPDKIYI